MEYSAAVTVPPSAESSPYADSATSPVPVVGFGLSCTAPVTAPVTESVNVVEPTTPQLPATSWARTNTVCRPCVRVCRVAVGMVAVAPVTVGPVPNAGEVNCIGEVPSATDRSSTTNSAESTVDPPLTASVKSAVTVTGFSTLAGSGLALTLAAVGPTWSPLTAGGLVSRNVSMPPNACAGLAPGGGVVPDRWPLLFSQPPDSMSANRRPSPEAGMPTTASTACPGCSGTVTAPSGYAAGRASWPTTDWSRPSRVMACGSSPASR
jgi:hypothetical protein